jgi:hypothetical protein
MYQLSGSIPSNPAYFGRDCPPQKKLEYETACWWILKQKQMWRKNINLIQLSRSNSSWEFSIGRGSSCKKGLCNGSSWQAGIKSILFWEV